mmetsp:Transcript_24017/g.52999  ORF Transcript_24017/g.52999 Transcript_24017/m.52999 type:complete len:101 (-) Transcript_24017:113-415(-)
MCGICDDMSSCFRFAMPFGDVLDLRFHEVIGGGTSPPSSFPCAATNIGRRQARSKVSRARILRRFFEILDQKPADVKQTLHVVRVNVIGARPPVMSAGAR